MILTPDNLFFLLWVKLHKQPLGQQSYAYLDNGISLDTSSFLKEADSL